MCAARASFLFNQCSIHNCIWLYRILCVFDSRRIVYPALVSLSEYLCAFWCLGFWFCVDNTHSALAATVKKCSHIHKLTPKEPFDGHRQQCNQAVQQFYTHTAAIASKLWTYACSWASDDSRDLVFSSIHSTQCVPVLEIHARFAQYAVQFSLGCFKTY